MCQLFSQCGRAGRSFKSLAFFAVIIFLTFLGMAAPSSAAPSANADLDGIGLMYGSIGSFSPAITRYTVTVPSAAQSTNRIYSYKWDAFASIKVNGVSVAHAAASAAINIPVGTTTVIIEVTAEDNVATKEYTIDFIRAAPVNVDLSDLTLSSGWLNPSFGAGTTSYTATVANGVDSITLTPTVADATSTVKVNGTSVTSGSASGQINLSVGTNTITAVVTAQDGTTTQAYTVTVTRSPLPPLSSDATLAGIGLSTSGISPTFSSGTTNYTSSVANNIPSVRVTPYASDANATITVNGTTVASGTQSGAIALAVGGNTVTIIVKPQDNSATQTYTVTVNRAVSSDAGLAGLSVSGTNLSPSFASGTTNYAATVANSVSSITVTPTVADPVATVTVNGTSVTSGSASGAIALSVGANTVTSVVTAADGVSTQTYTVIVTRSVPPPASSDATLVGIGFSNTGISPSFAPATTSYTSSLANNVPSTRVWSYASDGNATIKVNGVSVASGVGSGPINLAVGDNPVVIAVTAEDGTTTKTYTVTVNRAASSNADLAGLTLSSGSLNPSFSTGTASYTATVPNSASAITVRPTVADPTATVTVNGTTVTSGSASTAIPLAIGSNTITTVVTAQDGTTTSTYTVTVTRQLSSNADLASLALSNGTLSPSFAGGTTSYTASVANSVTSITVTPMVAELTATVTVNGTTVTSGSTSAAIALAVGANTVTTTATAQDGTTTKIYTVTVTRAAPISVNADLAGLALSNGTLSPSFAAGTTSYTASVANGVTSITVTPTVADLTATVTVNGTAVPSGSASAAIALAVGTNTVTTTATAQDGTTTKIYTVTVTRAAPISVNADLAGLALSNGTLSPSFAAGTTGYTASVANSVTSITVTPTVAELTATVTVNGTTVTSGSASAAIALAVGANTVTTTATAQDGTTTKTYTVTVTRAAPISANADLAGLALSNGTLSPSFAAGTTSYTASVANSVTSITVTPTVAELTATVTVNGTTVTSGSASAAIALAVGANTVTTTATAQDGTTTKIYTVTVTRAAPISVNADLAGLALSNGTLSPSFAAGTTSYTASVANGVTSITVTPTVADLTATVTVNGTAVPSGSASAAIALAVGTNTVTTTATAQDGTTTKIYTVTVTRAAPVVVIALSPAAGALPDGTAEANYSQVVSASGGMAPYGYSVTAGALPAGLVIGSSTGAITGTPTAAGDFTFTITAADANGATGSAAYTLKIKSSSVTFVFTPSGGALADAMAGEDYSQSITAKGGVAPLLYRLASGALPNGVVLNISTGELNGPLGADADAGDYGFTIQVSDRNGATGTAGYTVKVTPRVVTVSDLFIEVPAGSAPGNVYLNRGATGGPFTGADLVSVEPANAGTATIIRGELAQAGAAGTPAGWYLKFVPDPAYSGQVEVGYRLIGALGPSNTGIVTYKLAYDTDKVTEEISALVHDFVRTRQNMISSSIKVPGLLERRQMMQATDPVTARMMPSEEGMTASFSTSLNQIEAAQDNADGVSGTMASPFNIWIDGAFLAHNRDENGSRWGSFAMINAGADYLLTEKALVGLSFHYDRMTDPTDADAELTGNGWLAGPYASLEVAHNIFWNASLRYGGSSNDIDTRFWDGTFDTTRWMADTSITGQWDIDADTIFTPNLRIVYFSESVDDYSVMNDAGGTIDIEGFDEEQFRVSLGAEVARSFTLESGATLTPKLGVTGGFSGLDGTGAFGSLTAGLSLQTTNLWMLDLSLLLNIADGGETSAGAGVKAAKQF